MTAQAHTISISGGALSRGFWLYVWDVRHRDGRRLLYVGRTGDSSSLNAQSPFRRLSEHLGRNKHGNALKRHLENNGIALEDCENLEMTAFGPSASGRTEDREKHQRSRDHVAALEKRLADALSDAGYHVLNKVYCLKPLDDTAWGKVVAAFGVKFDRLNI